MFNKLAGFLQGDKPNHPLGSKAALGETLSDIPLQDPSRVLAEIDNLIEDVARYDSELSPHQLREAVIVLDEFAHPAQLLLTQSFVLPGQRNYNSELIWAQLERHSRLLALAYTHCLQRLVPGSQEASQDRSSLALCAVRAMQAWVEHKKLHHFRYHPPETDWWLTVHQLVNLAAQHGVLGEARQAYADEPPARSTLHAYLAGLYLELGPVSNLVPVQLEVLQRWLQQNAASFEFAEQPHPGTTHYLDINQPDTPRHLPDPAPRGPQLRFCSTRRLRSPLLQLVQSLKKHNETPAWLAPFMAESEQLDALVENLLRYWADQRPQRACPRLPGEHGMRVVHGLTLARRMIACSSFALEGKDLRYRRADWEELYNLQRFGRVDVDTDAAAAAGEEATDPMETLQKLETAGDRQMMEEWVMADRSNTGIGAVAAALRSRNRIGELVGYRLEGELNWQLAVIRRIGRDKARRASIGMETLPSPQLCAQLRPHKELGDNWTSSGIGHGFVDAIQVGADTLLLPRHLHVALLKAKLVTQGQQQNIALTETLEQGSDWVLTRFQPISQETP